MAQSILELREFNVRLFLPQFSYITKILRIEIQVENVCVCVCGFFLVLFAMISPLFKKWNKKEIIKEEKIRFLSTCV